MKYQLSTVLPALILLASCSGGKQAATVKSVTIESISYQTETMFTITCDKFDYYYKDKWKSRTLTNKDSINKFTGELYGLKRIDNGYQPNVRVKILLTNTSGTVDTVCLDDKVTQFKGVSYETSVELANMVQE